MKNFVICNGNDNRQYNFISADIKIILSQDILDIQSFLNTNFNTAEEYVIYVPAIINNDSALSYSGVELALWIYTFFILHQNVKFHIIILGTETKGAFFEHCRYANIVLAPNVHFVQNSHKEIDFFLNNYDLTNYFSKDILIQSLKSVNVEPPSAFKNAHTITNEWCIYRWSKALSIERTKNEIEDSLYFTYIRTILSIDDISRVSRNCTPANKVLVVDDEIDKGWNVFFESLLSGHVKCIGSDFKKAKSRDEIIQSIKMVVEEYDPDTIILDLRLHDSDHTNYNPKAKLTGIKVLEEVKRINKGIQVIGFTASNKVWNLTAWQELGIDGFIIKESPSKSVETGYTEKSINLLIGAIEKAASKAYLKEIYKANHEAMNKLRQLSNKKYKVLDKSVTEAIISYLQLAQSSLFSDKPNLATAFMYYFLIIEAFSNQMIDSNGVQDKDKVYYFQFRRDNQYLMQFDKKTGKKLGERLTSNKVEEHQHDRIPYAQKLFNMIDYVGIHEVSPVELVRVRNAFNHPNLIDSKPIIVNYQNVKDVMNIVCKLINNYK